MLMASTGSFMIVMLLMHLQLLIDAQESSFTITSDCVCPGQTIELECTVSASSENAGGSTVWKGDFFRECDGTRNNIVLLHSRFTTVTTSGASNSITSCNNGSIIGQILSVDPANVTYTSQLTVIVGLEMIGQSISCEYDSSPTMINASSINLKLVQTQTQNDEVDFNVSYIDLLMDSASERVISFSWNQLNVSQTGHRCILVPNHFTILSSSCGICHNNSNTVTNQMSVNCTDVPVDAERRCLFVLIPIICGGPAFQSSTFVNIDLRPKKGIIMNTDVTEKKDTGLVAACVILTLISLILLTLIGIALLLRFKDHTIIKRMISFPNHLTMNFISRSAPSVAYTNCNQTTEAQTNISQYEEINIYSHLHESSRQEDNDRVLKIFDNQDEERGIYSLADEIDATYTLSANANIPSEREASRSDVCTRDKSTLEDVTEAQQKIMLKQELTGSEDTPPPKPPRRRSSVNRSYTKASKKINTN